MPFPTHSNVPSPLRWSLDAASREMSVASDTLKRRLIHVKERPAADGTYATRQLLNAMYGDVAMERLRKTREEADNMSLKNSILRGESLPRALLTPALESIFIVIKQLIQSSSMSTLEKRDLLNTIATWPIAVKTAAIKASKQLKIAEEGSENGQEGEQVEGRSN